jgi:hypothetical protein
VRGLSASSRLTPSGTFPARDPLVVGHYPLQAALKLSPVWSKAVCWAGEGANLITRGCCMHRRDDIDAGLGGPAEDTAFPGLKPEASWPSYPLSR